MPSQFKSQLDIHELSWFELKLINHGDTWWSLTALWVCNMYSTISLKFNTSPREIPQTIWKTIWWFSKQTVWYFFQILGKRWILTIIHFFCVTIETNHHVEHSGFGMYKLWWSRVSLHITYATLLCTDFIKLTRRLFVKFYKQTTHIKNRSITLLFYRILGNVFPKDA